MSQETYQAIQCSSYTQDLSGMEIVERPMPTPGAGEVLLRVTLRPINPADVFGCQGMYRQLLAPPLTPGTEGVAVVESDGDIFKKGQRVVGVPWPAFQGLGSWTQYAVVAEEVLLAVPDAMSDNDAAQFFINPVSCYGMLESVEIPPNKYVLLSGAASVFGGMMISLAKHRGIHLIAIVRHADQVDEIKGLGADEVIALDQDDMGERVRELTGGEGAWAGLDCVGSDFTGKIMSVVRPEGTVVLFGALAGQQIKVDFFDVVGLGKRLDSFQVWSWLAMLSGEEREQKLQDVMQLVLDGVVRPPEGMRFPLQDFHKAYAAHVAPERRGKILIEG